MSRSTGLPAALALAIGLAGCGGSSTKTVTQAVPPAPAATAPKPSATAPTATTPSPKPPTATAQTPETPTTPAQSSCGSTAGHFIRSIQSVGAGCATARQVANGWLARVQAGSDPAKPITVSGYVCAASFRGQLAVAVCRSGPSRIAFTAQP
jgi:hypothetical protein